MRSWITRPIGATIVAVAVAVGGVGTIVATQGTGTGGSGCEWPSCFPDASTTGVTNEGALTTVSGTITLNTPGETYENKIVNGCIDVGAAGVTIRNVRINCGTALAIDYDDDDISYQSTRLTVEDTEINCTAASGGDGFSEGNANFYRVEIRSCENGFSLDQNMNIEDSWIHDLEDNNHDPNMHEDGIQFGCGRWTSDPADVACGGDVVGNYVSGAKDIIIRHNRIEGRKETDGSNATSAIIMNKQPDGGDENILVEHNLLDGGGSTVYCTRSDALETIITGINVQVINNSFTALGGATTECADEADTSGNIEHETGDPYVLD